MIKRPMLAVESPDLESIRYPKLLSMKLDGIRCVKVDGKALSRKFKPIPNDFVRSWIEANLPDGIDGEIMVAGKTFNEIQSLIMSKDGEPDFEFYAFDLVSGDLRGRPYEERHEALRAFVQDFEEAASLRESRLVFVNHVPVVDAADVRSWEETYVAAGYEGVMLRDPGGPYKEGRSTAREEYLLKVKRWQDAEGEVIGFEEQLRNENAAETNELGLTKRSTKKEGLVPAGTLGKFVVRDLATGATLHVGTGEGMTKELRKQIWDNQAQYLGKLVTYKFQPSGMKELPRFPIWKGFRSSDDR